MAITIPILTDFNGHGITKAMKQFGALETKAQRAGFLIKKAFIPATAALGALAFGALKAVNAAADIGESLSKNEVLFGKSSGVIASWSKTTAQAFGISRAASLDAAGTFATFGKSAGLTGKTLTAFSSGMTELAGDLASFNNSTPQEAIDAIGSALRGEAEPMRRFGVLLSDATLRTKALEMGLIKTTKDALNPQQKVLAAHALILEKTKDAQGDFSRTADSATNRQKILKASLEDTTASLGEALLPAFTAIVGVLQSFAGWMQNNTGVVKTAIVIFASFAGAIVLARVGMAAYGFATTLATINQIGLNAAMRANPIGAVVTILTILAAAVVIAYQRSETFRNILSKAWEITKRVGEVIMAVAIPAFEAFKKIVEIWLIPIRAAIGAVEKLVGFFNDLKGAVAGTGSNEVLVGIVNAANKAENAVDRLANKFGTLTNKVQIAARAARLNLAGLASTVGGLIGTKVSSAATKEADALQVAYDTDQSERRARELEAAVATASTEEEKTAAIIALSDFRRQKEIENLRATATEQQTTAEKAVADLAASFNMGIINATQFRSGLDSLIGPGFGEELGNAFVAGFTSSLAELLAQIAELTGKKGIGKLGNAPKQTGIGDAKPKKKKKKAKGATGGIVTQPTFALIGEEGPEAVIPLNRTPGSRPLGSMGGGMGGITINVQAGLVSTPDQIGQQIIEAIQNAQRRSGPVFAAA